VSYMLNRGFNSVLELNLELAAGLTLTSVSGASWIDDIDSVGVSYFGVNTASIWRLGGAITSIHKSCA